MKKILIVSFMFPPSNFTGTIRVKKIAEYLYDKGYDVRVITTKGYISDESIETTLPAPNILYTKYYDITKGPRVLFSSKSKGVSHITQAAQEHLSIKNKLLSKFSDLYKEIVCVPDTRVLWAILSNKEVDSFLKSWKPDIVYSSSLPFSTCLIAKRISLQNNIPWVAEFRDLFVDNHYYEFSDIRKKLDDSIERRVLKHASAFVSVSPLLTESLYKKYQKPSITIYNGIDSVDEYPSESHSFDKDKFNIVYTGALYKHRRDPSKLFNALQNLIDQGIIKKDDVRVHFIGGSNEFIVDLAKKYKLSSSVVVTGKVKYKESLILQNGADALLFLLWDSELEDGVVTSKIFDYIPSKKPIIGLGRESNAAAKIINSENVGFCTTDTKLIEQKLNDLIKQKLKYGGHSNAIVKYSRANQMHLLEEFLLKASNL